MSASFKNQNAYWLPNYITSKEPHPIDIGRSGSAVYFQTPEGVVYADLIGNGQRQTVALRSKDFRNYLRAQLFDKTGKSPGSDAVQQAIDTLEALNLRDCPKRELNNRTARDGDTVYLDLANDSWQAIKITSAGWAIETDYPVRFRRGGCAPLATPTSGGNLEDLRTLLQLDHENWVKVLCWIVQSMMPSKEYPILVVTGARGSGKTTLTKAIKRIIDPTTPLTRGSVGTVRDFAIHASKRHTIAIDNISGLNAEQSDILCRSATGDGHAERLLHTDDEEIIFEFVNPLILNGIGSIATRDDLLDRSIVVNLQPLSDRSSADKYQKALETLQPEIFGALLDLLAKVLAILPEVTGTYSGDERFTGFVEIALAVEKAMAWETGTVLNTFATARQNAHQTAVESSPLGEAVLEFMDGRECYTGTASELLSQLNSIVTDRTKRDRSWPANGRWLSDRLCNRLAPDLKALGLEVSRDRGGSARLITIERVAVAEVPAIQPATEEFTELEAAEIKNCIEIAEVAATATPETVVIAWQALKQLTSDRLKRAVWAGLSIAARNALTQAKQADKGKLVEVGQW
jgi:energy-coupling factor transporter ATP-binding protein EcfA2